MPNFTNLTHEQLKVMDKADIIIAISNYLSVLTEKQIIELLMDATKFADRPEVTTGEYGFLTREQTIRDALGDILRVETMEYDYYDTGEVHNLVQTVHNAKGRKVKQVRLEHFRDGRQPRRTVEAIEKPMEP